ncbi:hypothetical protein Ava_0297 [Trichormus variabilis ATCC 29413]|uniref:Helix-turn-helix domain-containing protein n=2 Tax=Anabaena variabilis TaxID=264691 RepID=Q3MGG3_TRIV2|nr:MULTISPECIES: hypothetical protein [Nostocaceae]ABA19923.1 hypothetical protein Ava_0297 [Trichormus variabilis ATCC 29413]MBC1213567.1 helix-turn-helix domain-containing protein [Trichormus variabilis ARAD]MBC1258816.1 helix-turn-helix domain-containing protein [Trichormus variabilis V5]MBC1268640.1 helix-turn-helix domain-containing protein [Trichormus variabilis FSR]MBC1304750.1 helix-turn-helix domain-containing protein [Trichormus variabilis N2B]
MLEQQEQSAKQLKSHKADSFPSSVAYIHNFLDEYGLDPYEFRLYTHIIRRTGGKPEGVCFASLRKTAEICKMSMRKAQQALKVLMKANLVIQRKRNGRTDEYRITPVSEWVAGEKLDEIRQEIAKGTKNLSSDLSMDNPTE